MLRHSDAGPRLGDGPRWDLRGAVDAGKVVEKKKVEERKVERENVMAALNLLEERSERLMDIRADQSWNDDDDNDYEDVAPVIRSYIERLEKENDGLRDMREEVTMLRGGPDARCRKMLDQALSQSDETDVRFVTQDGTSPIDIWGTGACCARRARSLRACLRAGWWRRGRELW